MAIPINKKTPRPQHARLLAPAYLCTLIALPIIPVRSTSGETTEPVTSVTRTPAAVDARESRIVLAEGRAAVGPAETGGALAAKQAAVAVAMRNAVEKVVGVYVAANSLTRNYQLLKDEILTRADGYVVLKEIVRTEREGSTVRVVIRAEVSTRPLAERLKALRLTRAFRVFVQTPDSLPAPQVATAFTDAGFPVVENRADSDLIVRVSPRFTTVARTPLKTAAGEMVMHSVRADVKLTAARSETGEIIATLAANDTAAHISLPSAQTEAATSALTNTLPLLTSAVLTLPAQVSEPVEIVVSGIDGVKSAAALGEVIVIAVPGVQKVTRRSYASGRAVYEADVLADATPLLARALETAPALKRYRLRVTKESRSRVVAVSAL